MAARFWVGGSGTWDNSSTANWSATSGGASGASAPTTADTVTFDNNSGTAATVSVAATATTSTCTINKSDINLNFTGSPTFTGTTTLTAGTITLNTFTLTCSAFSSSNSNVRTIAFGTGAITITAGNATVWSTSTSTNLVVTGTPTVNANYSGSTGTRVIDAGFTAGGTEANSISFNITAGSDALSLYGTALRDINLTGFSGIWGATGGNKTMYGSLTLGPTASFVSSGFGQLIFSATSGTKTISVNSTTIDGANFTINAPGATYQLASNVTLGTGRTCTLTAGTLDLQSFTLSCGAFSGSNSNTRAIAFGTGNITITGSGTIWSTGTITGLTTTGSRVVNVANNTATAATVTSGALSEANAIDFNFTTGTYALTFPQFNSYTARNVNFTGFAGTWNAPATLTLYGDLTLSTGMTLSAGSNAVTLGGTSGTQTVTTNGKTIDFPLTFNGVGGTFRFADALTMGSTRAFTVTNGTVRLKAGTTNTVGSFTTGAGAAQRFLQSDTPGTRATITDPSGTNTATYLTIRDIAATGGATWQAFLSSNNVDMGNNVGWDFNSLQIGRYMYNVRKSKRVLP